MRAPFLAAAALTWVLTACGTQTAPSVQLPAATLEVQSVKCPVPGTVRQLARVTDGLLFLSETDAPFSFVSLAAQRLPAPAELAPLIEFKAANIVTVPFGEFFQKLTTIYDPADPVAVQNARRFAKLRDIFRQAYGPLTIYRVQDAENPAKIHIYILGRDRCGVSGLETLAVET